MEKDNILYINDRNNNRLEYFSYKNYIDSFNNEKNKKEKNIKPIILLQSFIRRFLIRNKIYKSIMMFYKINTGFNHVYKYIKYFLFKFGIYKFFIEKIKKVIKKRYLVCKSQLELIKELKKRNVNNFNEFKNFVIWCINNDISSI